MQKHFQLICSNVFGSLAALNRFGPNERVPKEEHLRCVIFSTLSPHYTFIAAERGYSAIESGNTAEADLWLSKRGRPDTWLELKRAWSAAGWTNKPGQQQASWQQDVDKLATLPLATERVFLLVAALERPLTGTQSRAGSVEAAIMSFHPEAVAYTGEANFQWRSAPFTRVHFRAWRWAPGNSVQQTTS